MMADLFPERGELHDHGCKVLIPIPSSWQVNAVFAGPNDCNRLKLMHRWSDGPMAFILMMNPSGAGLRLGDQTVMKTSRIFRRHGFGGQWIGNTSPHRHKSPKEMRKADDQADNSANLSAILEMAAASAKVVIAHGRLPSEGLRERAKQICWALQDAGHKLHMLRLTKDNVPMHPLARGRNFIPEDVLLQPWAGPIRS